MRCIPKRMLTPMLTPMPTPMLTPMLTRCLLRSVRPSSWCRWPTRSTPTTGRSPASSSSGWRTRCSPPSIPPPALFYRNYALFHQKETFTHKPRFIMKSMFLLQSAQVSDKNPSVFVFFCFYMWDNVLFLLFTATLGNQRNVFDTQNSPSEFWIKIVSAWKHLTQRPSLYLLFIHCLLSSNSYYESTYETKPLHAAMTSSYR